MELLQRVEQLGARREALIPGQRELVGDHWRQLQHYVGATCRICDRKCGRRSGMTQSLFDPEPYPTTTVIDDLGQVADYLKAHVGVSIDDVTDALDFGTADAATVTANAAAASFSWRLWDGAITRLRDRLGPSQPDYWTTERPGGLEVVRRRDNLVQITAGTGTPSTGLREGSPTSKNPRGASTVEAIDDNQRSFEEEVPDFQPIRTWWLLVHVFTKRDDQDDAQRWWIRAELSLPTTCADGAIGGWYTRLLLGERPFGTVRPNILPDPAPEPTITLPRREEA